MNSYSRTRAAGGAVLLTLAATGLATAGGGAAADGSNPRDGGRASGGLTRFADCEAFAAYVRQAADAELEKQVRGRHEVLATNAGGGSPITQEPAVKVWLGGDESHGGMSYAPIGVRDAGAGQAQPDVAKADGTRVLTLGRREGRTALDVIETAGRAPRLLGSVPIDGATVGELLPLGRGRVLAIRPLADDGPATLLTLIGYDEPAHPQVLGTSRVSGHYVAAIAHGGVARVAVSSPVPVALPPMNAEDDAESALADARAALAATPGEAFLPELVVMGPGGGERSRGPLVGCTGIAAPQRASGLGVFGVVTVDPARGLDGLTRPAVTAVAANRVGFEVTADRVYLTTNSGGRTHRWASGSWERVSAGPMRAAVHAFDPSGRHVGSGTVPGHQIARGGLSAYAGHVRIATTTLRDSSWSSKEQQSRLLVLAERDGRLVTVGRLPGLAKGEYVHFVRWFGPHATVGIGASTGDVRLADLGDPSRPRLRGRLTDSGYPQAQTDAGPGRMVDVRYSADNVLTVTGFALTGTARDATTARFAYPKTWTTVGDDPRMLTWLPGSRLAFVPAARSAGSPRRFALAFRVGRDGTVSEAGAVPARQVVMRVLEARGRIAVVTTGSVTVLDPQSLRPLGTVPTAVRRWPAFGA